MRAPVLWRININTDAKKGVDPRKFCIDRNLLGVGWQVKTKHNCDWDTYYGLGLKVYKGKDRDKGWWPAVNALRNRMAIGDLCWTRDLNGIYYLGKIAGEWLYMGTPEYNRADVHNVRKCNWEKIGTVDAVPGKVVNSFIPSRTVQQVHDESSSLYSQFLYNRTSGHQYYNPKLDSMDLFSLISNEDCEDIVGLFLQEKGYRMVASSCKTSTLAYEYVLIHHQTGTIAVAQIKQGHVDLRIDDYASLPCDEVYLFTTQGKYIGEPNERVKCLTLREIEAFVMDNRRIMPRRVKTWINLYK